MTGSGRETLPDVRQLSGGPSRCLGGVGIRSRMSGRPSRMSGSGWEDFSDVRECWEDLPNVRKWSRHTPGCLGVVGGPSLMSGNVGEAFPDVREWSGGLL